VIGIEWRAGQERRQRERAGVIRNVGVEMNEIEDRYRKAHVMFR